jgi:FG-GAP repeat
MKKNSTLTLTSLAMLSALLAISQMSAAAQPAPESIRGTVASLPLDAQQSVVSQLAKLTATDGVSGDYFGFSAAMSGDTVVVGAPYVTVGANTLQGAVYIFVKPATGWANMTETAKLTASDGRANSYFGTAVALSGNMVVVAAGIGGGVPAYVFNKPPSGWASITETAKLTSPANFYGGGASPSVSTDGNTVVLGVPWTSYQQQQFEGMVYVYAKPVGGWTGINAPTARLVASDGFEDIFFGMSVSVSGNTVVACAAAAQDTSSAAYVYVKPAGGWVGTLTETARLTPSNSDGIHSVSIAGNTVAAGAPGSIVGGNSSQGAVYVFVEPTAGWVSMNETAKLTASDGATRDQLGISVAIGSNGNEVAAGAYGRNSDTGAAYAFVKPSAGWSTMTQSAELTASDGAASDRLGSSVSTAGSQIVTGAPTFDISEPGAAYVFGSH